MPCSSNCATTLPHTTVRDLPEPPLGQDQPCQASGWCSPFVVVFVIVDFLPSWPTHWARPLFLVGTATCEGRRIARLKEAAPRLPDSNLSVLTNEFFEISTQKTDRFPGPFLVQPVAKNGRSLGTILRPQNWDRISVPFNKTKGNGHAWSLFCARNLVLKMGPFLAPVHPECGP